jgi:hypothetical protein
MVALCGPNASAETSFPIVLNRHLQSHFKGTDARHSQFEGSLHGSFLLLASISQWAWIALDDKAGPRSHVAMFSSSHELRFPESVGSPGALSQLAIKHDHIVSRCVVWHFPEARYIAPRTGRFEAAREPSERFASLVFTNTRFTSRENNEFGTTQI